MAFDIDMAIREKGIPLLYQHNYRLAMRGKSRKAAIQAMCLECQGWDEKPREAIRDCAARSCSLWTVRPYQRFKPELVVKCYPSTEESDQNVGEGQDKH